MLELNITIVYQIIGYFVLLLILARLLYRPVVRILEERARHTDGARKEAEAIESGVVEGRRDYERRLKEAVIKGQQERERLRNEAREAEKAMLEKAREEAGVELSRMRTDLEKNKTSGLDVLKKDAGALSRGIAGKLLDKNAAMALAAVMLAPAIAFAVESGHEASGASTFWRILNFIVLAGAVYYVWTRFIKGLLDKRSADIAAAMDEARAMKEAALARKKEYEEKLGLLEDKMASLQQELRLEGEAEKQRILKEAALAAEKIRAQARIAAQQEIRKAMEEIRAEVAALAVDMAEGVLRKEMSAEDHKRLIREYTERLKLN